MTRVKGKVWGNALGGYRYQKRTKRGTFASGLNSRGKVHKVFQKVGGVANISKKRKGGVKTRKRR